jgi:uncharacterized phage infection (PIP) family protein YhgE
LAQEKRKSFTFEETDLEWINPLLIEWVKENEGMKQGDLIKQLLIDYRLQIEKEQEKAETLDKTGAPVEGGKSEYAARVSDALSETSTKLKDGATKLQGQLKEGYGHLTESIGKLETRRRTSEALNVTSEKLKSGGKQISSGLKKGYEQLLKSVKKRDREASEEGQT